MRLMSLRSEGSQRRILHCTCAGATILIFMSGVALAAALDDDLREAARVGDARKVVSLLQEGADVNAVDSFGWTPLKRAAQNNQAEIAALLIENGAEIDALHGPPNPAYHPSRSAKGYSALHRAALNGHRETVEVLIAHGATLDVPAPDGLTAHALAWERRYQPVANLLRDAGADMFSYRLTAKFRAYGIGTEDDPLLDDLLDAARKGDGSKVIRLLQEGANVNADDLGWTPLKKAAEFKKAEVVALLIENGAEIDALHGPFIRLTAKGYSALHRAALNGHRETVEVLIAHGAALDLRAPNGLTALATAFSREHEELIPLLLEAGADPFPLFLTPQWRKAEEKNDTRSYQRILERYPTTILATEADRRITDSEHAFFQTARIGTEDAVKGFIKSHPSSDRIPFANAYLEYLDDVDPGKIRSARSFLDSSPDNPFARIVEVQ